MSDAARPSRRPTLRRTLVRCLVALALACGLMGTAGLLRAPPGHAQAGGGSGPAAEPVPLDPRPEEDDGRSLYRRDCAHCHGPQGRGSARGPSLEASGTALVHYMLATGRMPIRDDDQPLRRKRPLYGEDEIRRILDHVSEFIEGPEFAPVDPEAELVQLGGRLFRNECAACHQFVGTGGVLIGARQAPTLHHSSPEVVRDAIRTGPSTMPAFSDDVLSERDVTAIATYVANVVQAPEDRGGLAIGHFGPFAEGFVAWFGGMGVLLVAARWIGKRT